MNGRGPYLVDTRPFGVRLEEMRGEPKVAAGIPVTPVGRRLALWWPGGGWVYAWPTAIEYPEGNLTRRKRIVPIQTLALGALAVIGLAALAGIVAQWWLEGRENASERNSME